MRFIVFQNKLQHNHPVGVCFVQRKEEKKAKVSLKVLMNVRKHLCFLIFLGGYLCVNKLITFIYFTVTPAPTFNA